MSASMPALQPPQRVAVFRALMLGDLLCATPALRAMRHAWPDASITLIGLPWAAQWAQRQRCIDDFEPFPGWPGLPEQEPPTPEVVQAFVGRMRARRFDLAIQLHGSGGLTNALVARWGARHCAGFGVPEPGGPDEDAACFVPWPTQGHEIERLLAMTDRLGVARRGLLPDLPLSLKDHARARALLAFEGRYVVVHPGSQLPSRRWLPERFAAVADRLSQQGLVVVLTGSAHERELTAAVAARMAQRAVVDLAGRTDLWTLGGVLASAALLVSNDTGLSHMAAALGTPSVVVACGSEVARWAPLDHRRHTVLWEDVACRPCSHHTCPVGHVCALAVNVEPVVHAASALLTREQHHAIDVR